jgi:hypothetical protein
MKRFICCIILLISIENICIAQTAVEKNPRPNKVYNGPTGHAIGAVLSSCNGKGLGYRYWKHDFGFHATFFPASSTDNKFYNAGITGYMTLREYEIGRLFLHAGIEYQTSKQQETISNYNNTGSTVTYQRTNTSEGWNIGAGPGIHLLQRFVSLDVFIGYGTYIRQRHSDDPTYDFKNNQITTLSGGIALWLEL